MYNIPSNLLTEVNRHIKNKNNTNRWYIIFKFDVLPLIKKKNKVEDNPILKELVYVAQSRSYNRQSIQPIPQINKSLLAEIVKFDRTKLKSVNNANQTWWDYFISYVY